MALPQSPRWFPIPPRRRCRHEIEGKESTVRKTFAFGGVLASIILIAFGIGSLVVGANGRSEVRSNIAREQIVGTPDMTPSAIATEAKKAGLPAETALPTCSVAGKAINTGDRAKCFASYMRIHTLEATGGYTYAEIGRYQAKPDAPAAQLAKGGGTDNPDYAVTDVKTKQPVANGIRDIWVTETALTTALNTSFFAERVSVFSIVMGAALLLTGIGFLVLTLGVLYPVPALARFSRRKSAKTSAAVS
jgi:hypothetical protein